MSSLHEVVSTWKVSSDTVQKFEVWLYSPDRGWKPTDPVDDAFFTISEEDLVQAGLTTLKERRQILAKIKAAAGKRRTCSSCWDAPTSNCCMARTPSP